MDLTKLCARDPFFIDDLRRWQSRIAFVHDDRRSSISNLSSLVRYGWDCRRLYDHSCSCRKSETWTSKLERNTVQDLEESFYSSGYFWIAHELVRTPSRFGKIVLAFPLQ